MTFPISQMYGLSIFDIDGAYLGKAHDFILNMETGEVVRITTEQIKSISSAKEDLAKLLQKKSIMYKRVKSVKDIIVVGK
ncbi:MAG: PRC-barrel domain-containing protein [archaeon]